MSSSDLHLGGPSEIPCSALPQFQHVNAIAGVISTALHPSFVREYILTVPHPATGQPFHTGYLLKADNTSWISKFSSGTVVELTGSLTVRFSIVAGLFGAGINNRKELRLESMEFEARGQSEFIQRETLAEQGGVNRKTSITISSTSENSPATTDVKDSPSRRKPPPKRGAATRRRTQAADEPIFEQPKGSTAELAGLKIPPSPVGSFGITEMGMRCLEVCHVSKLTLI